MNILENLITYGQPNREEIYGWISIEVESENYREGDVGLIDLIGNYKDPAENCIKLVYNTIWETRCQIYEANFCPDIGKVYLSYVGPLNRYPDYILYFNVWIQSNEDLVNPININLLETKSLSSFCDKDYISLGKVRFFRRDECPYL